MIGASARANGLLVGGFGAGGGVDVVDGETATSANDLCAEVDPI